VDFPAALVRKVTVEAEVWQALLIGANVNTGSSESIRRSGNTRGEKSARHRPQQHGRSDCCLLTLGNRTHR
jgi:hypothetical protein